MFAKESIYPVGMKEFMSDLIYMFLFVLTLVLLARIYPAFANSVDPDQLASEEANWSGSALFVI